MLIKWLINLRRWETGQWSGADDNPSIVAYLLQEEMQEGWIEEVVGGENKLKQRFPQVASGKLNLALAPNRSCSYLNRKSHVLAWYFRRSLSARRCTSLNVLCTLDIGCCKGTAHNSRFTLMTEGFYVFFQEWIVRSVTLNFGARASGYYWGRVAGKLMLVQHRIVHVGHSMFVYV